MENTTERVNDLEDRTIVILFEEQKDKRLGRKGIKPQKPEEWY